MKRTNGIQRRWPKITACKCLILLVFLTSSCASQQVVDLPDSALQAAILAHDCRGVYEVMGEDIHHYFGSAQAFCDYYALNEAHFERWASGLHDRFVSDDYERYAYFADDPEGTLRMRYDGGSWVFETPPEEAKVPSAAALRDRFVSYLWRRTSDFLYQLDAFLKVARPTQAKEIYQTVMRGLKAGPEAASITFDGPLARVKLDQAEVIFIYHKRSAVQGAWELYRCHLSH